MKIPFFHKNGSNGQSERLDRLLEHWLRYLRDHIGQDYSDCFSLSRNHQRIRFQNIGMPVAERVRFLECVNKLISRYKKTLGIRITKNNPFVGDGCSFTLQLNHLSQWQEPVPAPELRELLLNRGQEVAQEMLWRNESVANQQPFFWRVIPRPGFKSLVLEVTPNHGRRYPAYECYKMSFQQEMEGILNDFPGLGLRLDHVSIRNGVGTAWLDFIEKGE